MKLNKIIITLLVIILLVQTVYGFGVTTPYWTNNPLVMSPGQTVEFSLLLQNMVGGEDLRASAKITSGAEFVEIIGNSTEYFVPFGAKDVEVNLKVKVPESTNNGNYSFTIQVDTMSDKKEGMIQLSSGIDQKIPLIVRSGSEKPTPPDLTSTIPKEKQEAKLNIYLVLAALVVIILVIYLLHRFKKKKNSLEDNGY